MSALRHGNKGFGSCPKCGGTIIRRPGIVLDCFMGAGTTALVSAELNRQFIGCELNPEYVKMAEKRIAAEVAQQKMF